jgi:metal-sulfur cluster biosynthetic enzyme
MNVTTKQVLEALSQVIDPEMGIDLVSLGLIYDVKVHQKRVSIRLTLTQRGCPVHDSITGAVRLVVLNLDGIEDVDLELVWDPPWTPDRMTPEARARLT